MATMKASSIVSRLTATSSGSSRLGATGSSSRSGYGWSQVDLVTDDHPVRTATRDEVEAGVRRDAVEPAPQQRPSLELSPTAPRSQEGLLHDLLGFVERSEHAVAVDMQLAPEPLGHGGECGLIARSEGGDDLVVDGRDRHRLILSWRVGARSLIPVRNSTPEVAKGHRSEVEGSVSTPQHPRSASVYSDDRPPSRPDRRNRIWAARSNSSPG